MYVCRYVTVLECMHMCFECSVFESVCVPVCACICHYVCVSVLQTNRFLFHAVIVCLEPKSERT